MLDHKKALFFAAKAHQGQSYGTHPYTKHLNDALVIAKENLTTLVEDKEIVLCATVLHDTIEDTNTTKEALEKEFSKEVALIVWRVSDGEGKNRAERALNTYWKIRECQIAVFVKLCDRIANTCNSKSNNNKLFAMYKKEYQKFKAGLFNPNHHQDVLTLWKKLDELVYK